LTLSATEMKRFLSPCSRTGKELSGHRHTELHVGTHPMGIRQCLAFLFSSRREVIFPGFPLSDSDIDSTLRRKRGN
jgi:hypothetical protein